MAFAGGGGGGGSPPTIQWTFPNTLANDQNNGLFTFVAAAPTNFIGFDIKLNVAPTGQDIVIDWKVNGVIIPAYQLVLPANQTKAFLAVAVALAVDDELQPVVTAVGTLQPGQTAAIRARGV
jgi:hypothetical protein